MTRSRALASPFLPLVLGALVLRALIPAGFMPATGSSGLIAMMCAPGSADSRTETLQIPGTAGDHCAYCGLPTWGGAPGGGAAVASCPPIATFSPARVEAPAPRFALSRVQIPRAPPA